MRFDGKYILDPISDDGFETYEEWDIWCRATLDSLLLIPSPFRIDVWYNYLSADSDSVYVGFDLVAESDANFNMTLRVGVTDYQRPQNPTGRWRHNFRRWVKDDLPDSVGWSLGPMSAGESLHFDVAYETHTSWNPIMYTFIFVQRNGTRKIQQGWWGEPGPISGVEVVYEGEPVRLGRNVPNPFAGSTTISYSIRTPGEVHLGVYTLTGRLVTELVNGYAEAGPHSVAWDGRDRFGREVASGVYYYILEADEERQAGKMILLR
jgi:hypothetical protein